MSTPEQDSTVELNLTDEEFINLAKEAHMQDLTLNQYINNILKSYIDSLVKIWYNYYYKTTSEMLRISIRY